MDWLRRPASAESIDISDDVYAAACNANRGQIELRRAADLLDERVIGLVSAVDAERAAGFPGGRLFLDSVEQALALSLVDAYAVRRPPRAIYRGGLAPGRLRKVTEFVDTKIDEDLTLEQMADSVNLSVGALLADVSQVNRPQSHHRFRPAPSHRAQKEILGAADMRVLDVAVACGFKTQQHFARVFRQVCGISPSEYRQEVLR